MIVFVVFFGCLCLSIIGSCFRIANRTGRRSYGSSGGGGGDYGGGGWGDGGGDGGCGGDGGGGD